MSGRLPLPDIMYLQRIVVLVVFGKIQSLCFLGNTLTGVILESSAGAVCGYDALLDAKRLFLVQFCAVDTVGAGALNFLTKQHDRDLIRSFSSLYNRFFTNAMLFADLRQREQWDQQHNGDHPKIGSGQRAYADGREDTECCLKQFSREIML